MTWRLHGQGGCAFIGHTTRNPHNPAEFAAVAGDVIIGQLRDTAHMSCKMQLQSHNGTASGQTAFESAHPCARSLAIQPGEKVSLNLPGRTAGGTIALSSHDGELSLKCKHTKETIPPALYASRAEPIRPPCSWLRACSKLNYLTFPENSEDQGLEGETIPTFAKRPQEGGSCKQGDGSTNAWTIPAREMRP